MHKQIHEVMGWAGPMTHRQFLAWQVWLGNADVRSGKPDPADYPIPPLTAEQAAKIQAVVARRAQRDRQRS